MKASYWLGRMAADLIKLTFQTEVQNILLQTIPQLLPTTLLIL